MNCYCFHITFPKELNTKQQDILISFFKRAIDLGITESKNMASKAKRIPGISKHIHMLENMQTYMEAQKRYFALEHPEPKKYIYVMPSMKRELIKLKGHGLAFPDVRTRPIKKNIEEHVFPEMKITGKVEIKEEERDIGEVYGG